VELKLEWTGVAESSLFSFYRTIVELKWWSLSGSSRLKLAFYRTIVELKCERRRLVSSPRYPFYRTIVELKVTTPTRSPTATRPFIVPLWNCNTVITLFLSRSSPELLSYHGGIETHVPAAALLCGIPLLSYHCGIETF